MQWYHWKWHWNLMMLTLLPVVSHATNVNDIQWCWCQWHQMTKKSCSISFQLSWPKECNGDVHNMIWIKWSMLVPMVSQDQKWMQWCHWWCCLHHILLAPMQWHLKTPTPIPLASFNANADASGIAWQKIITPHFNWPNLMNAMVLLMMLLASCHTDARANGITGPKSHVASHFNHLNLINVKMPFTIPWASCDDSTGASGIT